MIILISLLIRLGRADECVRFYILKEGLIRPDQDVIVSRSPADYYAADFRDGGYEKTCKMLSCESSKYRTTNNCGKVKYYEISNNITFIESMIIEPDYYVLDTDETYIDWYVLKDESATAGETDWHIDGQVMPREYVTVEFYDNRNGNEVLLWRVRVRRNVEYNFDDDVTIYEEGYRDESLGYVRLFERWEGMGEYDCIDITNRCEEGKGRIYNATHNMKFIARWTTGETSEAFTSELTEAFTSALTEEMTEALTEALTEAFTSEFTEALTEEMTEAFTSALTSEFTEALTSEFTEALTSEFTEALTEAFTSEFTEALTEAFTSEFTQPFTQPFTFEITQPFTFEFTPEFTPSSPFNALSTDKPPSLSPPIIAAIVVSSLAASAVAIFIAVKCCIAKQSVENIHQMDGLVSL